MNTCNKKKLIGVNGEISQKAMIKVLYTNADMLTNKMNELNYRVSLEDPDIIAINEVKNQSSKRKSTVNELKLDTTGYIMVDNNIDTEEGRGQIVYVKENLNASQIYLKNKCSEEIVIAIDLSGGNRLVLALLYRSPSGSKEQFREILKVMREIISMKASHTIFVGDFNLKNINWRTLTGPGELEEEFLDFIVGHNLYQHVTVNTRFRGDDNPSLLDLILTNHEEIINEVRHQSPLGKSDHNVIEFDIICKLADCADEKVRWRYSRANFENMLKS